MLPPWQCEIGGQHPRWPMAALPRPFESALFQETESVEGGGLGGLPVFQRDRVNTFQEKKCAESVPWRDGYRVVDGGGSCGGGVTAEIFWCLLEHSPNTQHGVTRKARYLPEVS